MKTKSIILAAFAALALTTVSCSDKLDIKQHGVLNFDTYYQTDEQIESAIIPLYTTLRGSAYYFKLAKDMFSDDSYCGGATRNDNIDLERMNEWTFDTEQDYIENMFTSMYQMIYRANVILGHVDPEGSAVAQQIRAEAKVFRAYAYFELISMWGNPPIVDHELSPSEYNVPNGSTEDLWALVETDLTEAINSGYLTQKSNVNDKTNWRLTKQAAQALLGKAYLWMAADLNDNSYYAKSAAQFDAVVSSGLYDLYTGNYADLQADKYNCEVIIESNRIHDENSVWNNFSFYEIMIGWRSDQFGTFGTAPVTTYGWGFRIPKKDLYDAFVADEGVDGYRLNQTMKTYQQIQDLWGAKIGDGHSLICEGLFYYKMMPQQTDVEPGSSNMAFTNDYIWMRFAEVLLCGSEAHFMAGNTAKASEYLNRVRGRAGLSDITATLDAIKLEKRLELCTEGTRFQDLLRWGEAYDKLKEQGKTYPIMTANGEITYNPTNNSTYGFKQGKHDHLPYPATEIRLNSEIQQNPGW